MPYSLFADTPERRAALWYVELAGWLHNLGKLHPDFYQKANAGFRYGIGFRSRIEPQNSELRSDVERYKKYWPQAELLATTVNLGGPFDNGETYTVADLIELQRLGHFDAWGRMKEILAGKSRPLNWLLAIAHERASDSEKQAENGGLESSNGCYRSTVFGYEEARLPGDVTKAWDGFGEDLERRWTTFQNRERFLPAMKRATSGFPADKQWPINDITLFDMGSSVAALLKASVARCFLEGRIRTYQDLGHAADYKQHDVKQDDDLHRWRPVRFALDGESFCAASNRIPDIVKRRSLLWDLYDQVQRFIETDLWLANEIYRDPKGPVFLFPVLEGDEGGEKLRTFVEQHLKVALQTNEIIGEVSWQLQLGPSDSRGLGLSQLLALDVPPPAPDLERLRGWWSGHQADICSACGLRPIGPDEKSKERKVCSICLERRENRSQAWIQQLDHTIWLEEVADRNGRMALITAQLDLKPWLAEAVETQNPEQQQKEGIGSLVLQFPDETRDKEWRFKNQSFARIERVIRTGREFWDTAGERISRMLDQKGKRLRLRPREMLRLARTHSYELSGHGVVFSAVWTEDGFITADNMERLLELKPGEPFSETARGMVDKPFQVREQTGYGLRDKPKETASACHFVTVEPVEESFAPLIELSMEPHSWRFLVPAVRAHDCVRSIWERYQKEMELVRDRLSLRVSVLFADVTVPLHPLLLAADRMAAASVQRDTWDVDSTHDDTQVTFGNGVEWDFPAQEASGNKFYSCLRLSDNRRKLPRQLRRGDRVATVLSTYDAEYFNAAGDRFDLQYDKFGKRRGIRRTLPMPLEMFKWTEDGWKILADGNTSSQLNQLYLYLRQKEEDWGMDTGPGSGGTDSAEWAQAQEQWHAFCLITLRELEWRKRVADRYPDEQGWQELKRLVEHDLLLDMLELHLKVFKARAIREEQDMTNAEVLP